MRRSWSSISSAPCEHTQCFGLLQTLVDIRLAAETVSAELKDIQRLLQVLEKLFALVTPAKQKCVPLHQLTDVCARTHVVYQHTSWHVS